ncbi:MAG: 30S ribosomal protein S12 methylthiotransferase RimO [Desulfovibrionaceae bacterium]|nr:30S ribosomal protein S12 methylthiotransferase RimO [Desulfovibrionaceae bacterium]
MVRVYSQSLGCPKNRVDTERLLGSLGPDVVTVTEPEEADLVFINTCAFIQPAVEESVRAVVQMAADLDGLEPRPLLAVGGCLPGRYGLAELAREVPEVDLWLHSGDLDSWPRRVAAALKRGAPAPGRLLSTGPSYAWLKISEGCRHHCSFCTIPSIRGPHRSAPAGALADEARALLADGVRELVLVGQDVTAWGEDRGQDLRFLLDELLPLPGLARLRLMYLYPAGLNGELLDYLARAGPPFVPYFDVPLQHAHPDVLGRMGRPFAADPQAVVDRIRAHFPQAALRTTMIVGFPGETDQHFQTLMDFVERGRFHHLGVFAYQAEEGTPAAAMDDQVPVRVREARRDALMSLQNGISEDILSRYEGERLSVLVDAPHGEWPGLYTGRVWFQAPEVDGVTYVSGPGVTRGALVDADIVEARDYDLVALA